MEEASFVLWLSRRKELDGLPSIFSGNHNKSKQDGKKLQAELYQQIGQLKVELDWLKKKLGYFD